MDLRDLQGMIADVYLDRDRSRGAAQTFAWLVEEIGELSRALRNDDRDNLEEEFADVLAWLLSLANIVGVDMESAATTRYGAGCKKCGAAPCTC